MNITALVQHHPARAHLLPALLEALAPLDVEVITDPEPDGPPHPWRTYRACLDAFHDDASHVLVVQDDAIVCRDFAAALPNAVRAAQERSAGDPLLVPFVPGHDHFRAIVAWTYLWERSLVSLPVHSGFTPVVATVWPRRARDAFLAWCDDPHTFVYPDKDDGNVGSWARECAPHVVATVPSLVEHGWEVDSVSQPGRYLDVERRAAVYIGDRSALDVFPALPLPARSP